MAGGDGVITHETRRESHLKVDKAKRQRMILDAYHRYGGDDRKRGRI